MSVQRNGEDPKHVCDMCHRTFQYKRHYMKHLLVHKERTLHQCPICMAGFISEFELSDHLIIHTEESRNKCKYCSTSFSSPCKRKDHENKHTKENCLICDVCHGMFQTKLLLLQHLHLHRDTKQMNAVGFTQREGVETPTNQQKRKKQFLCQLFGEKFRDKYTLERHQDTLNKEKQFPCPICGPGSKSSPCCGVEIVLMRFPAKVSYSLSDVKSKIIKSNIIRNRAWKLKEPSWNTL
ncbi:hypothetical protein TNCT_662321 [Trichonephila clavata]|uniref:C2H2-type domain-containing protein n=1 Tax=Trichonephila clavata TaxID=2740835 RepID=A0A8X6K6L5_TRICU|nr:hypothetical protein TNCT_662321 [Trichonephila clavata]